MKWRAPIPVLATIVAVVVLLVTVRSQEPVGAGVYYDDGAYLALARSLAEGDGYAYSNLPDAVPGVKYPPAYPLVLAATWKVFGAYPENLTFLKALNALFWSLAALGTFLLFGRGGAWKRTAAAAVTLYAFLTVPSMSIATVLMAEPFFLLVCVAALLLAGLGRVEAGQAQPGTRSSDGAGRALAPGGTGPRWLRDPVGHAAALGGLGAAAFLTRSIGLTLVVALVVPFLLGRHWKSAVVTTVVAAVPATAWLLWAGARADDVPRIISGQYGSYGAWVGQGLEGGALDRLGQIVGANWGPFVETLQFVWIPRTSGWALTLVLVLLGGAAACALPRVWRRNPALALFPFVYLAVVFVWPYEPFRFYYVLVPLLTLLAFEGLWAAVPRVRGDLPRWGVPVGVIALVVFVANALAYHGRGHALRSWATPQTIPAQAYAPLNEWIRESTAPDAVVASALDPHVHWQTGRPAVPSWRFLADDYGRYDRTPEVLAADLDSIIVRYDARLVALILGENKAARTLEAFVELHPDRAVRLVETPGPVVGVIYAVAPPGVVLRDPEATEEDGAPAVPGNDGGPQPSSDP